MFPYTGAGAQNNFIPIPGGESLCFTHSLKVKIKDNLPFRSSSSQLTNPPFQGHPLPWIHSASFSPATHLPSNYILKGTAVFQSAHIPCLKAFTFDCCNLWRRQWHPTPVLLPWESHGRRSLVGYSPWGPSQTLLSDWTTKQGQQSDRIESSQTASFQLIHTLKALYPNTVTPWGTYWELTLQYMKLEGIQFTLYQPPNILCLLIKCNWKYLAPFLKYS